MAALKYLLLQLLVVLGFMFSEANGLTKCDKDVCYLGKCTEVDGVGAVCSCPDTRMYLDKDGRTCKKKTCNNMEASRRFSCGSGAKCNNKYDVKLRLQMPQCYCPTSWSGSIKYVLDLSTQSCKRDPRYKTCDWPTRADCDQGCKTVYNTRTQGTSPQCTCRTGYSYDNSQKKCIMTDPCKAENSNGGCAQQCDFNGRTLAVTCSCHSTDYTLGADGKSCVLKHCANGNSGCEQNCIPLSSKDYYCTCNRGYHLNPDSKTCYDYDECAGHHGCDQKCVPDGKGYFFCDCSPGYKLSDNGYSCTVAKDCPELSPPENGYHGCDDWHVGTYCEPKCKTGFAFYDPLPSNKYHCGDDGTWIPASALPKCYPTVQPTEATLVYVSKYRGTCPKADSAALKSVMDMAQITFDRNKGVFCFAGNTCSIPDGPTVECKGYSFTISLKTDEDYSKVPERNMIIVEFQKKVRAMRARKPTQTFMGLFIPPLTILLPLADPNGLPSTPIFSMKCPATSKNIGNNCVTCPPGASC